MARQTTFSDIEGASRKRVTKRDELPRQVDAAIPWAALVEPVRPHYYEGRRGRKPVGIERMLRMYFLQLRLDLSDEGAEDAVHDSGVFSESMGVSLGPGDRVPDATTPLKSRRIIESEGLAGEIPSRVNGVLEAESVMMRGGSVVDAAFVEAPSSTKNAAGRARPERRLGGLPARKTNGGAEMRSLSCINQRFPRSPRLAKVRGGGRKSRPRSTQVATPALSARFFRAKMPNRRGNGQIRRPRSPYAAKAQGDGQTTRPRSPFGAKAATRGGWRQVLGWKLGGRRV